MLVDNTAPALLDEEPRTMALATLQTALSHPTPGAFMLANMPAEEFAQHLQMLKLSHARVQEIQKSLMEQGVHYGKVPGVEKPFLHQPGAEVLAQPLHLVPEYIGPVEWGDGISRPMITVSTECRLHYGTLDGPVVGTGRGACTSWERKYRYRKADRTCPECGRIGSVRKSKEEYGGGWYCASNSGGCGSKFKKGDARIEKQELGMVENPDQADLLQTIQAMADKRAYVKAVRTTTATSDLFTQDPDLVQGGEDDQPPTNTGKPQEPPKGAQPPAAQQKATSQPKQRVPWPEGMRLISEQIKALPPLTVVPVDIADRLVAMAEKEGGWTREAMNDALATGVGLRSVDEIPDDRANSQGVFHRLRRLFAAYSYKEIMEPEPPLPPTDDGGWTDIDEPQSPFPAVASALPPTRPVPVGSTLDGLAYQEAWAKTLGLIPTKRRANPLSAAAVQRIIENAGSNGWTAEQVEAEVKRQLGTPLASTAWLVQDPLVALFGMFPPSVAQLHEREPGSDDEDELAMLDRLFGSDPDDPSSQEMP